MASHRCSVTAKQHDNKRLALLDGIERAVQSVNLQLGSLRRSQRFLAKVRDSRWLKQNCHERVRVANSKILFNQWRNEHPSRYRLGHNLTFTNFGQEPIYESNDSEFSGGRNRRFLFECARGSILPHMGLKPGAPGVSAGKCTVSVLNPSPQNHRSETIATPLGLMCPW